MARTGPAPKAVKHGHGGAGFIKVEDKPYDGPGSQRDLPAAPGLEWFPQVEAWWEVIRTMPHCVLWSASDWLFAIESAYLLQDYWGEYFGGTVHASKAAEIRRRQDQMGTTIEARRKLGIEYIDPIEETGENTGVEGQRAPGEPSQTPAGVRPIGSAPSRRRALAEAS